MKAVLQRTCKEAEPTVSILPKTVEQNRLFIYQNAAPPHQLPGSLYLSSSIISESWMSKNATITKWDAFHEERHRQSLLRSRSLRQQTLNRKQNTQAARSQSSSCLLASCYQRSQRKQQSHLLDLARRNPTSDLRPTSRKPI